MNRLTSLTDVAATISKEKHGMDRREAMGLAAAAAIAAPKFVASAQAETVAPGNAVAADGSLPGDSTEFVPLWPGTPPGGPQGEPLPVTARVGHAPLKSLPASPRPLMIKDDVLPDGYHNRLVYMIQTPGLIVYRAGKPNGLSLLIIPGGGYSVEEEDIGGRDIAQHMSGLGITCFVLRYRLPSEGWRNAEGKVAIAPDVPLQDAQRAMRLIRANAKSYGIDPAKLAAIGGSAGGHLCASLATRFGAKLYDPVDAVDALSARPIVSGLLYPGITMEDGRVVEGNTGSAGSRLFLLGDARPADTVYKLGDVMITDAASVDAYSVERHVGPDTPPTFICLAADDPVVPPFANGIAMFGALRAAKIPTELHVFEAGGHGFGLHKAEGKPVGAWPDLFLAWAVTHGFSG
jgi:acetyl esterase/lipase